MAVAETTVVELNRLIFIIFRSFEGVNEAVLMAIGVAQLVCDDVVDGRATEPNPIPGVQQLIYEKAAHARRLAWDLLRTGLYDGATEAQ